MQESDRRMLMEFWLSRLLQGSSRPLAYARPDNGREQALVAFLLPLDGQGVGDADCQIILDPGPPCRVEFEFRQGEQVRVVTVPIEAAGGCRPADLLVAAEQVDAFWLFVGQGDSPALTLYEVGWHPQHGN